MAELIYLLCTATCAGCAFLLFRGYRQDRARLLLWGSVCFLGLTLNNAFVFVDLVVVSELVDLSVLRSGVALLAMTGLLVGLIWESR